MRAGKDSNLKYSSQNLVRNVTIYFRLEYWMLNLIETCHQRGL